MPMFRRFLAIGLLALACLPCTALPARHPSRQAAGHQLVVDLAGTGSGLAFRPDEVIGAGIDGSGQGDIDRLLTPHNIAAMTSAGLRPLAYRLRTELGIEAWHWNPDGSWSDPARQQGYWTSSDTPGAPIALSWGYRLPRRGDTVDNANNNDYSRLTDGDPATFWKSNPYLDPAVLHDGEAHPQWLILRLDRRRAIDAARIDWAQPFATKYEVQYWTGTTEYDEQGRWAAFPHGLIADGKGGQASLVLADRPVLARFVRVLLLAGSGTAPPGATDWRDRLGFAVREVSFGLRRADGRLDDAVIHAPSHPGQTFTHVSSTDPWHRAVDRDAELEQAGIDRIFASGLGSHLPIMLPVPVLFATPEDQAAQLRYIARRHYPVSRIELGEEPDGQYGVPADYGALYLAAVDRLSTILPDASFGGPSLQSAFTAVSMQPDIPGSWNGAFVAYLKRRQRLADLGFVSFEYYPFDDICGDIHAKLIAQDRLLDQAMASIAQDGVPPGVPRIISEYGFSAFSGRAMSEMPSALLMAGIVGQWTSQGGSTAYMFGYGPNVPANQRQPCAGFGNMMPFLADPQGQAATPMPVFYAAQLLTQDWTIPGHGLHQVLPTAVTAMPGGQVKAYALHRPDGKIAVLMINRSARTSYRLALTGKEAGGAQHPLAGPALAYSYGPAQYRWLDLGAASHPARSDPPAQFAIPAGPASILLPPDTIVVVALSDGATR